MSCPSSSRWVANEWRNVMAGRGLRNSGSAYRVLHRALEHRFVQMVTAMLTGCAVHVKTRGWEDPLPSPVTPGIRVLASEGAGQLDPACAVPQIGLVLFANALHVGDQSRLDRGRQHRHPVLPPLAVTDHDLVGREVDVFHSEAAALKQ